MRSPRPPQEQMPWRRQDQEETSTVSNVSASCDTRLISAQEFHTGENTCSQVQVIVCSCSSHLADNIYIFNVHNSSQAAPCPSLPSLTPLLAALLPSSAPSTPSILFSQSSHALTAFQLAQVHLQTLNLPSRAARYIVNPFEIPRLLNRTRINIQGLLSLRLLFNIWCVVVWVLIRRFLEIFGVRIGGARDT